jgi:3-phosphoshikimate 1-carboxyvinyltransferase
MGTKEQHIFKSRRAAAIDAEISVPPDKSISHRAVLLASLSNGRCEISNFLEGEDCRSTAAAMRQLGVMIESPEPGKLIVEGMGGRFTKPFGDLDCGNSGTTMRLMAGILASQPFQTRLIGDASLSKRPIAWPRRCASSCSVMPEPDPAQRWRAFRPGGSTWLRRTRASSVA